MGWVFKTYTSKETIYEKELLERDCEVCHEKTQFVHPLCLKCLEKHKHLVIKNSPIHGYGLFTLKKFYKEDYIAPYLGSIVTAFDLDDIYLYSHGYTGIYATDYYNLFIDASIYRGPGSYVNHSEKPNAYLIAHPDPTIGIIVKATKTIRPGEEILVDYGKEYFLPKKSLKFTTYFKSDGELET